MTESNSPINVISHPVSGEVENSGLTKREYFAAMALQGILSNDGIVGFSTAQFQEDIFSRMAVAMADALITELNKTV